MPGMQRNPHDLERETYDVLIIGGGVFGAAAARDAALRGFKTALIERHDFGSGASANCFKMVHGGIRYLQHGDVKRLRFSCAERTAFLKVAPHLVRPLPIVIPTYGRGLRGRLLLRTGTTVYDALTYGRNAGIGDPARQIANCRFITRQEVLDLFPEIDAPELTGAAIFEDGQMHNPARLVLAMVTAAVDAGAVACNYTEAIELIREGDAIRGAHVRDGLHGSTYAIRAQLVLNAAGPWAERLFQPLHEHRRIVYSRDACLTLARRPRSGYGLALPSRSNDRDALISRSGRHLFLAPWRDFTLLGVWHKVHTGHPDTAEVQRQEVAAWLEEINAACPALAISEDEVSFTNYGLLPFGDAAVAGQQNSFGKQSHVIDHREYGITGLVTVIGNRYTTARGDSADALDLLLEQKTGATAANIGRAPTDRLPLTGGDIDNVSELRRRVLARWSQTIPSRSLEALLANHGSQTDALLTSTAAHRQSVEHLIVPGTDTLVAEIAHAVLKESAVRLEDVVLRRTDLGAGRHPGWAALEHAANHMAALLGWSTQHAAAEVDACDEALRRHAFAAERSEPRNLLPISDIVRNPEAHRIPPPVRTEALKENSV